MPNEAGSKPGDINPKPALMRKMGAQRMLVPPGPVAAETPPLRKMEGYKKLFRTFIPANLLSCLSCSTLARLR